MFLFQDLKTRSEKNRTIVERVSKSGPKGYAKFKECLKLSHHEHLVEILEKNERKMSPTKSKPQTKGESA